VAFLDSNSSSVFVSASFFGGPQNKFHSPTSILETLYTQIFNHNLILLLQGTPFSEHSSVESSVVEN